MIEKAVSPEGAGDQFFGFSTPCGSPSLQEGETFDCRVPMGTYDVTEFDPRPNFEVGEIVCDDDDSTGDLATRPAHVVLDPAEAAAAPAEAAAAPAEEAVTESAAAPTEEVVTACEELVKR